MCSVIASYIASHRNTWEQDFEKLNIKVKYSSVIDPQFMIFNYAGLDADFSNELVKEARGIILDCRTLDVVCWPFSKFGNYHETYADEIDWKTARVQEKIDGSIIKLWYNKYARDWTWSTNGMIYAAKADSMFGSFLSLIQKCINYQQVADLISANKLNKDYTYIFELIGPENQVVIKYDQNMLYHIGTRSNVTGRECDIELGIQKPKEYSLTSLQDCLNAVEQLNSSGDLVHEGFVVVDKNYHRVKIKNTTYVFYHHFTNGMLFNKTAMFDFLLTDDANVEQLIEAFPHAEKYILHYQNEINRVERELSELISYYRALAQTTDRKTIALEVKNNKYAAFIFTAIDHTHLTAHQLLVQCSKKKCESLLADYSE